MTAPGAGGDPGREAAARLLLEAARPVEPGARSGALRAALGVVEDRDASGVLWEMGRVHGVLPLLARRVAALSGEGSAAPPELAGRLSRRRRGISLGNLHQLALVGEIAESLEAAGVPAMAFKGPVLAATVYPDPGLREFVDLDLLVPEEDRERALRLLRAEGFRPDLSAGAEPWEDGGIPDPPSGAYATPLFRGSDGCAVDLHWGLAPAHRALAPDPAGIRERAGRMEVAGRSVRVPSPEDHLLLLAVHGTKHGPRPWPKTKWIADVAWLLAHRPDAEWGAALARARTRGSRRALLLGVALARDLLDAPVPDPLGAALRSDPRAGELAREVAGRLFLPYDAPEPMARRVRFDWRVLERPRDRVAYVARRLLVPTGRDRRDPVGRALPAVLLYPYRWLRLLGTYLRRPSRLVRHWR